MLLLPLLAPLLALLALLPAVVRSSSLQASSSSDMAQGLNVNSSSMIAEVALLIVRMILSIASSFVPDGWLPRRTAEMAAGCVMSKQQML